MFGTLLTGLFSGMASGAGNLLMQAGGKLVTYIPTKAQSTRDKIYAETHTLSSLAIAENFDADAYAKHAGVLRDAIRNAANTTS